MKLSPERVRGQFVADFMARSWRADQGPVRVSANDLELLTSLLYNSGGTGLAWWRIHESDLATTPAGELLHQGYRLQSLQSAIQEERIGTAFELLRAAGIEPILIKGWATSRLYVHRTLRAYGDTDLVVRPGDYANARLALARSESPVWWIDLHQGLAELDDRSVADLFERSRIENHREVKVRILSPEDHLALLAMHYFKHRALRPSGLCDIAVSVESLPQDFDWKLCLGAGKSRRAWISSAVVLAHQLLGANIETVAEEVRSYRPPGWLADSVLKHWGSLLPADVSRPGEPRPLFRYALRDSRTLLRELRGRWPDPIGATFNLRFKPNSLPRLPFQLGAFVARAGSYLFTSLRAS